MSPTWLILEASCLLSLARPIAEVPSELDDSSDISIAGVTASKAARAAATAKMGSLESSLVRIRRWFEGRSS